MTKKTTQRSQTTDDDDDLDGADIEAFRAKRPLPEDPDELMRVTRLYRVMTKPVPDAMSKLFKLGGMDELDEDEKASGTLALAAVMYQEGAGLNAWFMVGMWGAAVAAPRLGSKVATTVQSAKLRKSVPVKQEK